MFQDMSVPPSGFQKNGWYKCFWQINRSRKCSSLVSRRHGCTNQLTGASMCHLRWGKGGGRRDSKQGRNSLHFRRMVHFLWYGCLLSLREKKLDFPDPIKINPSSLFKLLRWSSNSFTSMMSQAIQPDFATQILFIHRALFYCL
jgi:hypothetical protein